MKKNLLVSSPRGRAPTSKRAAWDRLDDNEEGLMDPVDAGDSAGSPQPTPSSESYVPSRLQTAPSPQDHHRQSIDLLRNDFLVLNLGES